MSVCVSGGLSDCQTIRTSVCQLGTSWNVGNCSLHCTIHPVKRPKLRLWLSPILPQLRLGKKIFHAKFWASEIAGTFVRVRLKFVLNKHWNQYFYYANFVSAIYFYRNFMVTLTKVPAFPEAWNSAWVIFLTSLNNGKIGESQCQSFMGPSVSSLLVFFLYHDVSLMNINNEKILRYSSNFEPNNINDFLHANQQEYLILSNLLAIMIYAIYCETPKS